MASFWCSIWWFIAGILLGWLLNWFWVQRNWKDQDPGQGSTVTAQFNLSSQSTPRVEPLAEATPLDFVAAKAAGFNTTGWTDLEVVEGIGPKTSDVLKAAGIVTVADLAKCTLLQLQSVMQAAGSHFRMARPDTWAEQARLAADNRWADLRALQNQLDGGLRTTSI